MEIVTGSVHVPTFDVYSWRYTYSYGCILKVFYAHAPVGNLYQSFILPVMMFPTITFSLSVNFIRIRLLKSVISNGLDVSGLCEWRVGLIQFLGVNPLLIHAEIGIIIRPMQYGYAIHHEIEYIDVTLHARNR